MKTFKEFIAEQAQAVEGDWVGSDPKKPTLRADASSKREFLKAFKLVEKVFLTTQGKTLSLYKHKTEPKFRLGYWIHRDKAIKGGVETIHKFVNIVYLDASRDKKVQYQFDRKYVVNIDLVIVDKDFRNNSLAIVLYNYLAQVEGYNILGDKTQYFGARALWSRLSKSNDIVVDIVDIDTGEYVDRNVVLHQGNYDKDFDKRLWSLDDKTHNIRSLLRTIK